MIDLEPFAGPGGPSGLRSVFCDPALYIFSSPDLAHAENGIRLREIGPGNNLLYTLATDTAEACADFRRAHQVMHDGNHSHDATCHLTRGQDLRETSRVTSRGRRLSELFAEPGGAPGECWTNIGTEHGNGYRTIRYDGDSKYVHRLSYEHFIGPIPDGMKVDHGCHNKDRSCGGGGACPHRACWNPAHLALASNAENILRGQSPPAHNARKATCPKGHPYSVQADGTRRCLTCRHERRIASGELNGRGQPAERTHCPYGHPYDEENTYLVYRPDGTLKQRVCRECSRQRVRARRAAGKRG